MLVVFEGSTGEVSADGRRPIALGWLGLEVWDEGWEASVIGPETLEA